MVIRVPELPTKSANMSAMYVIEEVAVRREGDFGLYSEGDCAHPSVSYVEGARVEVVPLGLRVSGCWAIKERKMPIVVGRGTS